MAYQTLGQRLQAAIKAKGIHPAELARRAGTTTATITNWTNDNVVIDHVKAKMLFQIADAAGINARELLLGEADAAGIGVAETPGNYPSQPLQLDDWKIAFQLVAEALDDRGLSLPPAKRAEVTLLAYELLQEGMQRAKVLRFVQAAAA
jgi:transcriptional regulator with XRE-family HTH domain